MTRPTLNRHAGDAVFACIAVAMFAVLGLAIWASIVDTRKWEAFKVAHNCKIVANVRGSTSVGFSSGGNVVVMQEADKNGWQCDDGVTYYR